MLPSACTPQACKLPQYASSYWKEAEPGAEKKGHLMMFIFCAYGNSLGLFCSRSTKTTCIIQKERKKVGDRQIMSIFGLLVTCHHSDLESRSLRDLYHLPSSICAMILEIYNLHIADAIFILIENIILQDFINLCPYLFS